MDYSDVIETLIVMMDIWVDLSGIMMLQLQLIAP